MKRRRLEEKTKDKTSEKIEIDRKELLLVLLKLKPALDTKALVEEMKHYHFMEDRICTYSESLCIVAPFASGFSCSIIGDRLFNLLEKMDDEKIMVECKDNQLVVEGKKSSFGLAYSEDKAVPELVESFELDKVKWLKLPDYFLEAVSLCSFAVLKDLSGSALTGVFIDDGNVVSSDNYRISWYKGDKALKHSLLIPGRSIVEMLKYIPTHYAVMGAWAHFKGEGVTFGCRLLDGEFPNALEHFPKRRKKDKTAKLPSDELRAMIGRAKVLVEDQFILDRAIALSFSGKRIVCAVEKEGEGWFKETIKTKFDYKGFDININPDFLEQVLSLDPTVYFVSDKTVMFSAGDFNHMIATKVKK